MPKEICLRYQVTGSIGTPEVEISVLRARIRESYRPKPESTFVREFRGIYDRTLVELLQSVQDHVKSRTGDSTGWRSSVPFTDYYIKKHPEGPFGIVYRAEGSWPLAEQSEEQRLKREAEIRDKNAKVHDRILPALEEFAKISGFQPT